MQKFIRIALPLACIAVIIWLFCDGSSYLDWKWLACAAGIGGVCYAVLYVRLHKMIRKRDEQRNQRKEQRNQLRNRLKEQAEEAVAPELEKVKGNSLKKDMIKRHLIKEYIDKKIDETIDDNPKDDTAIENIKGWLSSLKWSLGIIGLPLLLVLPLFFVAIVFSGGCTQQVSTQIDYHNADDLRKATGVKFPEIVPVDSLYSDGGLAAYNTNVIFVSVKPLDKEFYCRLDQACNTDSCCWSKDSTGYKYFIYPEAIPFDRTKGMHRRMVDDGHGNKVPDWDGEYISVFVPIKGDSIILDYGWIR